MLTSSWTRSRTYFYCTHFSWTTPPRPHGFSVIFAAIHGTAVALSWVLYLVASDASYQKQLYDELAELVNGTDDASALTPSVLKVAKYLDSFTREVLRWRPDCLSPTPRKAMKDITLPNGYIIPKGWLALNSFPDRTLNICRHACDPRLLPHPRQPGEARL